jgi:enoyl-CoA hydratase
MQKINSAFDNMGMRTTQTLATLFDGMTPLARGLCLPAGAETGFHQAVAERDSGEPSGSKPPRRLND